MPVSVATYGRLVYVLNVGGTDNVSGFRLDATGDLTPISGSTRPLSTTGTGCRRRSAFTRNGRRLVVTEKMTNKIDNVCGEPERPSSPVLRYINPMV